MFRIKTKKDKRIEYLENLLMAQTYKRPTVIQQEKDVQRVSASVILEPDMPISYAKRVVNMRMADVVEENIYFDVEDDKMGNKILRGYLNIVIERR